MLEPEQDRSPARRAGAWLLLLAAGIVVLAALGAVGSWALSYRFDGLAFLGGGPAGWIVPPMPPRTELRDAVELEATFRRGFDAEAAAGEGLPIRIRVRARGAARLSLNGEHLLETGPGAPGWKRITTVETAAPLRASGNIITATVAQASGPPALNLVVETVDGTPVLRTDERWLVSLEGSSELPARLASRRPAPDPGLPGPGSRRVGEALARGLPALGVMGLLSALGVAAALAIRRRARRLPEPDRSRRLLLAPAAVALVWVALFANNADPVPGNVGFDVRGHLAYIDRILEEGSLPLAPDGWQAYQPPLFYLLCAAGLAVSGMTTADPGAFLVLRAITGACGIAQVLLLGAIARLLWPRSPARWLLALGFAAVLPMHLYGFHYTSNETLAMTLATATSFLALRLLVRRGRPDGPSPADCALLGACLGLAVLAKFSALVLAPPVAAALLWLCVRSGGGAGAVAIRLASFAAAALAVCGWHFGRVWLELGRPMVGNWDAISGFRWWQDPGYRTAADYLTFGRALDTPWYAGYASVADGIWSTLWGDGLGGGKAEILHGAPWNHRGLAAGFGLALAPFLAIAAGCATGIGRLARGRVSAGRRTAAAYLLVVGLLTTAMLVFMTLRVPSYAQSKAFYAHPCLPVVCVAFALGVDRLLRIDKGRAMGFVGPVALWLLGVWALNALASVWVLPNAPPTLLRQGFAALEKGRPAEATVMFREARERDPALAAASLGLFRAAAARGDSDEALAAARAALEAAGPGAGTLAARSHAALGAALAERGETVRAIDHLRRAVALAPGDDPRPHELLAALLRDDGRLADVTRVLRDALAALPDRRTLHVGLARIWLERGERDRAVEQLRRALRQAPEDPVVRAALERALRSGNDAGAPAEPREEAGPE